MTHDTEHMTATPPPPPPSAPVAPRPPLRRSESDRVVAGVAGGLGRWLEIDPVIIRVLVVVLAIFGGSGLILYVIGWLFIPSETAANSEAEQFIARSRGRSTFGRVLLITGLVIVGLILLANLDGPFGHWGGGGAILLVIAGGAVAFYLMGRNHDNPETPQVPVATASNSEVPQHVAATTAVLPPPDPATAYAYGGSGSYPGYQAPVPTPPAPRAPRERSYLGLVALSVAIIVGGTLASLSWTGAANVPLVVIFGSMLAILGAGMVVGGFVGRAKWLTFLAVPLLMLTMLASLLPSNLSDKLGHGVGQRFWTPTSYSELRSPYQLSIGEARLDLTQLQLSEPPASTDVVATVSFGTLVVTVPANARVYVDATVENGGITIHYSSPSGPDGLRDVSEPYIVSGRNASFSGPLADNPKTGPLISLYLSSTVGTVEVDRA